MSIFKNLVFSFDDFDEKITPLLKKAKPEVTLNEIVKTIYNGSQSGPWIAGGMGRQMAMGEMDFNDIDVWFKNPVQFEQLKARLQDKYGNTMYETYASDNAITYNIADFKVQLIRRKWYDSIDDVFRDFDFTCCQVAVDENMRPYGPGIEDAKNYHLVLNRLDPKAFLARYGKYVSYGYVMDPAAFIKILEEEEINYEFDGSVFGY
jgi:hypothetical protein